MKNPRFLLAILLPASLAMTFFSCGSSLHSITVTPVNPVISLQTTQQFAATGTNNDDTTDDYTLQATWSSSNTSVATVNSSGLATAVGVGTTIITATSGGTSGSTTLTVISATLSISPASPFISPQATQQFTATNTDNQDVTWLVGWSSSNTSVARVNGNGLATAVAAGTTTITASFGSVWGSTSLTVTPVALSSISVTPPDPGIPPQATQQFTATGTFADGTTQDITSRVTWSSSNESVATVSNSGLATAVATGTTTIIATAGSISERTPLTVTGK